MVKEYEEKKNAHFTWHKFFKEMQYKKKELK